MAGLFYLGGGFVWDDGPLIAERLARLDVLGILSLWTGPVESGPGAAYYRPGGDDGARGAGAPGSCADSSPRPGLTCDQRVPPGPALRRPSCAHPCRTDFRRPPPGGRGAGLVLGAPRCAGGLPPVSSPSGWPLGGRAWASWLCSWGSGRRRPLFWLQCLSPWVWALTVGLGGRCLLRWWSESGGACSLVWALQQLARESGSRPGCHGVGDGGSRLAASASYRS